MDNKTLIELEDFAKGGMKMVASLTAVLASIEGAIPDSDSEAKSEIEKVKSKLAKIDTNDIQDKLTKALDTLRNIQK